MLIAVTVNLLFYESLIMDLSQIKISTRVLIFSIVNFSQPNVRPLNKTVLKVSEFVNLKM